MNKNARIMPFSCLLLKKLVEANRNSKNKTAFGESLAFVNTQLGKHYPLVINGEKIETDRKIISINPANKEEIIGYASTADPDNACRAECLQRPMTPQMQFYSLLP